MKVGVEKYIGIILKNSLISFSILFIFLIGLYPGISNFQLDASSDSLVLENDPDLKTYREMGNLFSDSDFLIVTMRPNESIFTNKSLQRIEKIENAILEIDGVSQEVVNKSHGVIEISQYGTKHSLNISVAAGIVIWKFYNLIKSN